MQWNAPGVGAIHPTRPRERPQPLTRCAILALRSASTTSYGRVDLIAHHPERGRHILEVEGYSSRQPDQTMYSALGQLLLNWRGWNEGLRYGIAVPETRRWRRQLTKIPAAVRRALGLELYLGPRAPPRGLMHLLLGTGTIRPTTTSFLDGARRRLVVALEIVTRADGDGDRLVSVSRYVVQSNFC